MRIGIFITVRIGSARLNGKALKEIMGEPVLGHLVKRIKCILDENTELYICTTDLEADKVFDKLARKYGVKVFHGNAENILKRHLACAVENNIDYIINIDGDDILCNPDYVYKIIRKAYELPVPCVIKTTGLPFGTNAKGYPISVLKDLVEQYGFEVVDTGWSELISESGRYPVVEIKAAKEDRMDDIRLTLDYEEDFLVFQTIIEALAGMKENIEQADILEYIRQNPQIKDINNSLNEIYWDRYNAKMKQEEECWNLEEKNSEY